MPVDERPPITATTTVVADPRQVSAEMGEGMLILHLDTGGYYSLSKVAARIWELLQNPVTASEVSEVLAREYGTARERCEADLLELLPWLPPASLARYDLLYPDPWPKRRHWKRRFVQDFLLGDLRLVEIADFGNRRLLLVGERDFRTGDDTARIFHGAADTARKGLCPGFVGGDEQH